MRSLTTAQEAVRTAVGGECCLAVEITLALKEGETEPVIIRVAEREMTIGGYLFTPSIRSLDNIEFSEGRAPNGTSVVIENASDTWGGILSDSERTLEGAAAVVLQAFWTSAGVWSTDIVLPCEIAGVKIDAKDIRFTLVSDQSSRAARVGGEPITQRCPYIYKDAETCGSTDASAECSHLFGDTTGGCAAKAAAPGVTGLKGNQPSFGGVPELQSNAAAVRPDNDNGWDDDFPRLRDRIFYGGRKEYLEL